MVSLFLKYFIANNFKAYFKSNLSPADRNDYIFFAVLKYKYTHLKLYYTANLALLCLINKNEIFFQNNQLSVIFEIPITFDLFRIYIDYETFYFVDIWNYLSHSQYAIDLFKSPTFFCIITYSQAHKSMSKCWTTLLLQRCVSVIFLIQEGRQNIVKQVIITFLPPPSSVVYRARSMGSSTSCARFWISSNLSVINCTNGTKHYLRGCFPPI